MIPRASNVKQAQRIVGISVCTSVRKISRPKIAITHHSLRPLIGGSETQTLCAGFVSQPPSLALFDFLRSGLPIGHFVCGLVFQFQAAMVRSLASSYGKN